MLMITVFAGNDYQLTEDQISAFSVVEITGPVTTGKKYEKHVQTRQTGGGGRREKEKALNDTHLRGLLQQEKNNWNWGIRKDLFLFSQHHPRGSPPV
jgi:hypothetical protein